jgi:hypothetical protein
MSEDVHGQAEEPGVQTEDAEANRLLAEDPLALMIGMLLDQHVQ